MSYSSTITETTTFTLTHAKHLASKVATDLKRVQRFYNEPSDKAIADYEAELIELLKAGYLGTVTYGYRKDGKFIEPTLQYTARELNAAAANDDDPGKIKPGADIQGASFYSYLTYSSAWDKLTTSQQQAFKQTLPYQRIGANEPGINGYLVEDRNYSAGGVAMARSSVRSF
jgi:hypothetical protein